MRNPFRRSGQHDPKLALLRRADTERDTAHSIGGRTRLAERKPITLARVPSLERPERACICHEHKPICDCAPDTAGMRGET